MSEVDLMVKDTENGGHDRTERSALGDELDKLLGPDEFKDLGEELALVIAKHGLTRKPEICEKVFRYMSFVIFGWTS